MVEVCGLVEDLCGVGEDQEAVGEAFRDPEELKLVSGGLSFKVEPSPLAEIWGVGPEIDSDIPDVAREDPDEFALGLPELVVEATQDAFSREGLVVLNELAWEAGGGKG
jgi:hypothetical protein